MTAEGRLGREVDSREPAQPAGRTIGGEHPALGVEDDDGIVGRLRDRLEDRQGLFARAARLFGCRRCGLALPRLPAKLVPDGEGRQRHQRREREEHAERDPLRSRRGHPARTDRRCQRHHRRQDDPDDRRHDREGRSEPGQRKDHHEADPVDHPDGGVANQRDPDEAGQRNQRDPLRVRGGPHPVQQHDDDRPDEDDREACQGQRCDDLRSERPTHDEHADGGQQQRELRPRLVPQQQWSPIIHRGTPSRPVASVHRGSQPSVKSEAAHRNPRIVADRSPGCELRPRRRPPDRGRGGRRRRRPDLPRAAPPIPRATGRTRRSPRRSGTIAAGRCSRGGRSM